MDNPQWVPHLLLSWWTNLLSLLWKNRDKFWMSCVATCKLKWFSYECVLNCYYLKYSNLSINTVNGSCPGCCSKSCDLLPAFTLCNTLSAEGNAHEGEGCVQSIGSTIYDSIVCSWLWLTATRRSPLGYFSNLLQVVDNWPHFCHSRFSTESLLAIEYFWLFFAALGISKVVPPGTTWQL